MFINRRMDKETYSNNKIVHKNKKEYISDTFKNINVRNSMSNENSQTKKKKKATPYDSICVQEHTKLIYSDSKRASGCLSVDRNEWSTREVMGLIEIFYFD